MDKLKEELWRFLLDDSAVGVVELILILVVLISLVLMFKSTITSLVKSTLDKVKSQGESV